MKKLANLLGVLLGRMAYTPPPWMTAINRFRKNKPAAFWALVIVLLAVAVGTGYRLSMPGPIRMMAVISPPGPPADVDDPVPDRLVVQFEYALDDLKPDQPVPEGDPSVARIDLIGKPADGIRMTPAFPGRWQWMDDRSLEFVPEKAWPAGTRFSVDFPSAIFSPETRLKKEDNRFETPAFETAIEALEFYQDPTDSAMRRVVAALFFSHPVNGQSLEQRLSMAMRPSGEGVQTPPTPVGVSATYDKLQRRAYISSDPVTLPPQSNTMTITVDKGVMPATGGNPTTAVLSDTVLIPDLYSFLKVSEANALIVPNERQEPEQVLALTFTDEIAEDELSQKLSVYLLPELNRKRKSRYWKSPREVTDQELAASDRLTLKAVPNERSASATYHFVIDVPESRYLYLRIDPNLTSVNGFVHTSFFDTVMATPVYPRQVQLAGEGSLLTFSGQQRLGMMARGLTALRITVGRLLPGQITHLVTQTGGDIRDPYFSNPNFSEEDIADFSREILDLKPLHPGRANYTSLDLSGYLSDERRGYGLFFVSVEGWDKKRNRPVVGASDQRLILITDLGLIVKNNADGSHEIFVQSIKTGRPVPGADAQLLGKNGVPLFRQTTGAKGHAGIPVTRDFTNEKQPSAYLVKTATDISFIPFAGHSRQIDYS
ncbi:MAG: alpha-2-macroglobulin family protein, partial [Desulfosarcina sp.]|nr:alpha-2-macroglobulin family protein [Desulfosarcina sp.]MBC2765703.1 alpha-2-macroglobulin family protein [Desulfosarcina sp.]